MIKPPPLSFEQLTCQFDTESRRMADGMAELTRLYEKGKQA